jgi:hypothetical protein
MPVRHAKSGGDCLHGVSFDFKRKQLYAYFAGMCRLKTFSSKRRDSWDRTRPLAGSKYSWIQPSGGVGSATGKEIQGLFVFSVLMRKHLALQRLALCLNFHLCHQHWEILRVIFGKKDYKRLQTWHLPFTQSAHRSRRSVHRRPADLTDLLYQVVALVILYPQGRYAFAQITTTAALCGTRRKTPSRSGSQTHR